MAERPTWDRVARLFARALRSGGEHVSAGLCRWDVSGTCQNPKPVVISAAPSEGVFGRRNRFVELDPRWTRVTLTVEMLTRCRQCERCLRRKAALWRFRARAETRCALRTWFGTLTLSPSWRYRVKLKATRSAARKGDDFEALEPKARFRYYANAASELATKWLKRVRTQSGAKFRYLLVVEEHKSGDPHFHILIHEWDVGYPVRKAVLKAQWSHGFSKWKLVDDPRTADYVCKYVSKSPMARVRASVRYGKDVL